MSDNNEHGITELVMAFVGLNTSLNEKAAAISGEDEITTTSARIEFTNYPSLGPSVEGLVEAFLSQGGGWLWSIAIRRSGEAGWDVERTLEATGEDRAIVEELEIVHYSDSRELGCGLKPLSDELLRINPGDWARPRPPQA